LAIEDEGWKTHRKIMEPLFNRNFLEASLIASVPSRVKQMIECWKVAADKHCEIDVASHASALSLDIIGDVDFDTNMHGVESIEAWADSIAKGADIPKIQDELITALVKVLEVDLKKRIFVCLQPPERIATMFLAILRTRLLPRHY
jgi:cytochrome P450